MARLFRLIALLGFGLALGVIAFTRASTVRAFIESTPCEQLRAIKKHSGEAVAQPV